MFGGQRCAACTVRSQLESSSNQSHLRPRIELKAAVGVEMKVVGAEMKIFSAEMQVLCAEM